MVALVCEICGSFGRAVVVVGIVVVVVDFVVVVVASGPVRRGGGRGTRPQSGVEKRRGARVAAAAAQARGAVARGGRGRAAHLPEARSATTGGDEQLVAVSDPVSVALALVFVVAADAGRPELAEPTDAILRRESVLLLGGRALPVACCAGGAHWPTVWAACFGLPRVAVPVTVARPLPWLVDRGGWPAGPAPGVELWPAPASFADEVRSRRGSVPSPGPLFRGNVPCAAACAHSHRRRRRRSRERGAIAAVLWLCGRRGLPHVPRGVLLVWPPTFWYCGWPERYCVKSSSSWFLRTPLPFAVSAP